MVAVFLSFEPDVRDMSKARTARCARAPQRDPRAEPPCAAREGGPRARTLSGS
jgi:hypothetical protein